MPAMRRGIPSVWGLEGCGLMVHVSLRAWNRALVPTRTKAALCSLLLQPERANPGASPHVPLGAGPWASCKQASPFTFIQHYQFKWILKEYSAGGAGTSGEPSALLPLSGRCALQRDSRPRASCARGLWVLAPLWFSFHFPLHAEVTGRAARRRAAVGARGASCPHLTPGSAAGPGRPQLAQAAQEEPQAVTRHPAALLPLELGTAGGAGSWGGAGGCSIPVSPLLPFLEPQLCQELFNYTLELLLWRGDVVRVPCKPEPARDRPGHQQEHTGENWAGDATGRRGTGTGTEMGKGTGTGTGRSPCPGQDPHAGAGPRARAARCWGSRQETLPAPAVHRSPCRPRPRRSPPALPSEDGAGQAAPQQEDGSRAPRPCQNQAGPGAAEQVSCTWPCWGLWGCRDVPGTRALLMLGISPGAHHGRATSLPPATPRPSSPQPGTSAEMERGRAGDPGRAVAVVRAPGAAAMPCSDTVPFADTDGFSALQVTTAKLSHPTATRPRVPGRRLPSMAGVGLGPPCAELCPHLPAAGQGPEQRLALEDLKAEVRSLHILVDLMRGQHLRDLEDVRLELQHERTKREALQAEIERVRKALPC
nr:translation initiation factor IF-2-like isoform X4 [Anser cygnoides]